MVLSPRKGLVVLAADLLQDLLEFVVGTFAAGQEVRDGAVELVALLDQLVLRFEVLLVPCFVGNTLLCSPRNVLDFGLVTFGSLVRRRRCTGDQGVRDAAGLDLVDLTLQASELVDCLSEGFRTGSNFLVDLSADVQLRYHGCT